MITQPKTLKIRKPDDWHVHLREGQILQTVLPYTSKYFARAMIMPNLIPRISTIQQAISYRKQIIDALPNNHKFQPLMTCYLTKSLQKNTLINGFRQKIFAAAKFYPANSDHLFNNIKKDIVTMYPLFAIMQDIGMPLLIHGEVNNHDIDIFDRESYFIDWVMIPIRNQFPELKIVLEHISTKNAVDYIISCNNYVGATITPQHLIYNRNDLLINGIKPHLYCIPIFKRKVHQQSLCNAISKGYNRFFIGTDTAPHLCSKKESQCGYAGIFNAPTALQSYAMIFEKIGALNNLEAFCSLNGPRFYNLPINQEFITLKKEQNYQILNNIKINNEKLVPFFAEKALYWNIIL